MITLIDIVLTYCFCCRVATYVHMTKKFIKTPSDLTFTNKQRTTYFFAMTWWSKKIKLSDSVAVVLVP